MCCGYLIPCLALYGTYPTSPNRRLLFIEKDHDDDHRGYFYSAQLYKLKAGVTPDAGEPEPARLSSTRLYPR